MNYYIGEIDTYVGESEYCTTIRFKTEGDPNEYLDNVASDFWGGEREEDTDSDGMYDFGDKLCGGGRWQKVDESIYNTLYIIVEINKGEEV
jgi:hypothetical protein